MPAALLSIPKAHCQCSFRGKCVPAAKQPGFVKPASKGSTGTQEKLGDPLPAPEQSRRHHRQSPLVIREQPLSAYACRAIEHRSRVLEARDKGSLPSNLEAMRAASDLRREIQLATKRLDDYAPDFGVEHCPKCFVFNNANVVLFYRRDPVVQSKSVIVTCSSCGFVGSIPSL
jgi:hypothetical protein